MFFLRFLHRDLVLVALTEEGYAEFSPTDRGYNVMTNIKFLKLVECSTLCNHATPHGVKPFSNLEFFTKLTGVTGVNFHMEIGDMVTRPNDVLIPSSCADRSSFINGYIQ